MATIGGVLSPDSPNSPAYLVGQIADRDREAFDQFYDRFASLVYSLAMRMLRVSSDAEDVLQEVFVQVWNQASRYNSERGNPEAWLINIARSRAIDKLRSRRRMGESFVSLEDSLQTRLTADVGSPVVETEEKLTVTGVLANLPESQRRVLELAYFEDLSQTEIAARLEEPLGTIKTRMRSGLKLLRDMLKTGR